MPEAQRAQQYLYMGVRVGISAKYRTRSIPSSGKKSNHWSRVQSVHVQGENTPLSLFKSTSDINLVEQFAEFFTKKVASIHESLTESNVNLHCNPSSAQVPEVSWSSTLPEFKPLSSGDIEEIIKSLPSKSCCLDPMQTISPLFSVTINNQDC